MIHPINHLPPVIRVGIQTEQGVESIGFDLSPWLTRWPEMTFAVWATRPGENAAYPVANTEMVGNVLYWYPNATDTEKEGAGTVEIVGVSEGKTKSSGPVDTLVKKTSLDVTQETPEPIVPWFQELQKTAGVAQQGAADAAASAQDAAHSAESAGQHAADADAQAQGAKDSADAAKKSEDNAAAHAASAEKAAQTAVGNADDAETSAQSAAASAQEVKDAVGAGEGGGLFLTTLTIEGNAYRANRTPEEIKDARSSGKTCILRDGNGKVYLYNDLQKVNYQGASVSCPVFMAPGEWIPDQGIKLAFVVVYPDRSVQTAGYTPATTPNPRKLIIKVGEKTVEYTGKTQEEVNIPEIPEDAGKLYIVTATVSGTGWVSDRSRAEIDAAVEAGKACLLHFPSSGEVMTYRGGYKFSSNMYLNNVSAPGLYFDWAEVNDDKSVDKYGGGPLTAASPYGLTIKQGDKTSSYDGSKSVQVEIPQGGGLPETAEPNSQLVTDEDGKVMWVPREDASPKVVILSETEFPGAGAGAQIPITTPLSAMPMGGATAKVMYNGTEYPCTAVYAEDNDVQGYVMGNLEAVGLPYSGGNPDAPFLVSLMPAGMGGIYGVIIPLEEVASITLSIVQVGGASSGGVVDSPVAIAKLTIDGDIASVDKTFDEIASLAKSGKIVYLQSITSESATIMPLVNYTGSSTPKKLIFSALMGGKMGVVVTYTPDGVTMAMENY